MRQGQANFQSFLKPLIVLNPLAFASFMLYRSEQTALRLPRFVASSLYAWRYLVATRSLLRSLAVGISGPPSQGYTLAVLCQGGLVDWLWGLISQEGDRRCYI